jgi:YVTN family beta-propeller protein
MTLNLNVAGVGSVPAASTASKPLGRNDNKLARRNRVVTSVHGDNPGVRRASRGWEHFRRRFYCASALAAIILAASASKALARNAYIANGGSATVSVINTQTNQAVGSPIKVGNDLNAIAITPNGKVAYVANFGAKASL